MVVSELIKKLESCDPQSQVLIEMEDDNLLYDLLYDIKEVSSSTPLKDAFGKPVRGSVFLKCYIEELD